MPAPAKPSVLAIDFPGLMSDVDPRDLPDGAAAEQINACSILVGELMVRRGIKQVTFAED